MSFHFFCNRIVDTVSVIMNKKFVYEIYRTAGSLKADYLWQESGWKGIRSLSIVNYMGARPEYPPEAKVRLIYDHEFLHVFFTVREKFTRCKERSVNGAVWEDSCVEFFFSPDNNSPERYFNLEINCGGVPLMHYNIVPRKEYIEVSPEDLSMIEIYHSLPGVIDPEITVTTGWIVAYSLPLDIIRKYSGITHPSPGVVWRANFYKAAVNNSNPHYMTWAPVDNPVPDFHLPRFFGELIFR